MLTFDRIALQVPTLLLPRVDIDLTKWAVIACDQYTSEPAYWEKVEELTAGSPSTSHLIFPEVYLEEPDSEERIRRINHEMERYLAEGILVPQKPGFLLVDRQTQAVPSRKGVIVALDLEQYDYREGAQSLIRATEGTILDRLPPRIRVREQACIELPHIMVLIDDPQQTVIEPLFARLQETVYDFPLMLGGGHIRGYRVDAADSIRQVAKALERLADPEQFARRYDVEGRPVVLYAMGDGNHSFATAKAIWEKLKEEAPGRQAIMDHPARYALVELVNLHDPGLEFEAIHRVLFDVDVEAMLLQMGNYFAGQGAILRCERFAERAALEAARRAADTGHRHQIPFVSSDGFGLLTIENPTLHLTVATLQGFLDHFLAAERNARIDYIHGEEAVTSLGSRQGNVGFYLPAISKHELFKTIILDGALPRKTFSMGEADEKRFYLECRKIRR
jgi:hypothetical protein